MEPHRGLLLLLLGAQADITAAAVSLGVADPSLSPSFLFPTYVLSYTVRYRSGEIMPKKSRQLEC